MTFYNNVIAGAAGAGGADAGYKIERSLRFSRSDSAYLSRNPSGGDRKKWTLSFWYKPCLGTGNTRHCIVEARNSAGHHSVINFRSDHKFEIYHYSTSLHFQVLTSAEFRDPSAWYHFVVAYDTDQSGADKVKIFCNGIRITEFDGASYPSDSYGDALWNQGGVTHTIGKHHTHHLDAYLAEYYWLDGVAPGVSTDDTSGSVTGTPSAQYLTDFGEFDSTTGVWNPSEYTGNYNSSGVGQVYSGMLTSSSGFGPTNTATEAFDGDLSTKASTEHNNDNYLEFTPTTPIAFTNGVQVYCYAPNGYSITNYKSVDLTGNGLGSETTFVGGGANFNGPAWINVATGSGTLYKLRIRLTRSGSNAGAAIHAIAINGSSSSSNYLVDGTPGGSNGVYLDFSDNSSNAALGTDSSGNNNTWTVHNLTEYQASTGDHGVTRGTSTLNYDPSPILDGNINTSYVDRPINGNGVNFTGIPAANTQLRVRFSYIQSGTMTTNGGHEIASGNQNGAWVEPSGISYPFTLTSISVTGGNSGDGFGISAIEVDGTILSRGSGANTDSLLDSPTNYVASGNNGGNYATFNPLSKHGGITLSNGNLELLGAGNGWKHTQTTIAMKTGKWYCEFGPYLWKDNNNHCQPGVSRMGIANTTEMGGADFTGFYHYTGTKFFNGQGGAGTSFGSAWNNNTTNIIGIAFDADTRKVWFSLNGVWQGSGNPSAGTNHAGIINLHADGYSFGLGMHGATDSPVPMNVGARPFAYSIPTGFKSLCTTNLSDPLIADGSTAFDILTWQGDGSGARTVSGLNLSNAPDLVWSKTRNHNYHHNLFDSVRGYGTNATALKTDYVGSASGGTLNSATASSLTFSGGVWHNENAKTYVSWAWDSGTVGTNEVGDYWSPPQYQTKYIGFKFPTSSGGRAVFGLTSGTGTADIFTSSDNNSWTRVQSNVTLSTTDTTYDSTSQYLIVVNTSNAVWGATHYAMATNGTDAHYSTQTYPGSGASFTWSGPSYTDWDFRSSGTVIKPGSLNSSVYNTSNAITSNLTNTIPSGSSNPLSNWFNGQRANKFEPSGSGSIDFTSVSALQNFSGTLQFAVSAYNPNSAMQFTINSSSDNLRFNSPDFPSSSGGFPSQLITIPVTSLETLDFVNYSGSSVQFWGIYLDGKLLVDAINNSQTWSNSLTALSGSSLTNPVNGFDTDESSYADSTAGFTLDLSGHTFGTGAHTIEVKSGGASSFTVNGTTSLSGSGSGAIVWSGTYTGELTSLESSATGASVYYVKIDGKYLADPGQNLVDNVPSIASTTRANQTAGFSIATATMPASGNPTIAHNLGAKPDFLIFKSRTSTENWYISHKGLTNQSNRFLRFDTSAEITNNNWFNNTEPTSSDVTIRVGGGISANEKVVIYSFSSVEGYSAFGQFSSGSDPFVYLGFAPRFVLLKRTNGTGHWYMFDSERGPINPNETWLEANGSGSEQTHANGHIRFLSNGFQPVGSDIDVSGGTYLYAAFAENPFKTARAR